MQPVSKLENLKKNKDLMAEVQNKFPTMAGRIDPIKKKFAFIIELESDQSGIELSPEDKLKLEGLDEAWSKFREDLEKAKQIINRCHQQLKTEVDSSIEEFKKDCQDDKKKF